MRTPIVSRSRLSSRCFFVMNTLPSASACASRPHATPTFIVATFSSVSRSAPLLPTVIFARCSRSTSDDNRWFFAFSCRIFSRDS